MRLLTIGFTKKSAAQFFALVALGEVRRVVDTRLNNVSQLAGFAKRDDLAFFLERISQVSYIHAPVLAPTQAMLDDLKKYGGSWDAYATRYVNLLADRRVDSRDVFEFRDGDCLLCSEATPTQCHRRLLAEYLSNAYSNLTIRHLV